MYHQKYVYFSDAAYYKRRRKAYTLVLIVIIMAAPGNQYNPGGMLSQQSPGMPYASQQSPGPPYSSSGMMAGSQPGMMSGKVFR